MQIQKKFLTPNKYSRPQIPLKTVSKIVVHYVGNPKSTAIANRNYFENQKNGGRYVSSHFIVGLDGEVIQCVPTNEVAYCSNSANTYSVSIECCHPDASGKFTAATEKSLAELCAYLCRQFNLDPEEDIIRHYDVTGKQCPLYWSPTRFQPAEVANARFEAFKRRAAAKLRGFTVRIIDDKLNVREKAGLSGRITAVLNKGGVYTIIKEQYIGDVPWGKLENGIGWISLLGKYVERL